MDNNRTVQLKADAIALLGALIELPSFSREEEETAACIASWLAGKNIPVNRYLNNVWAVNQYYDPAKPTLLLNSHHDTVKPDPQYTKDPFLAQIEDGKLYGLGSNDAGGCLVSLLATFLHFYSQKDMAYNLIIAATAEEEISGAQGVEALLQQEAFIASMGTGIEGAVVGEPTLMQMAIAERGLMVLDVEAEGRVGHAAREEGENALYKAIEDILWFKSYKFERVSAFLGEVKMTVTVVNTSNKAHNVVPAQCNFVVDVRVNDQYSLEELLDIIKEHVKSNVQPRSTRLRSSIIPVEHPLVKAGLSMGISCYGSPTTSDKALMHFPALKMGPGNSARSHTADEFIFVNEIEQGIATYIQLLEKVLLKKEEN